MASTAQEEKQLLMQKNIVQHLLTPGIKHVPPRFVKPLSERPIAQLVSQSGSIPVIDLSRLDTQAPDGETRLAIAKSCEDWGFFQIVNHGIPQELLDGVKDVTRGFFELPFEIKQRFAMKPPRNIGYGRLFDVDYKALDWVDVLFHYLRPDGIKEEELWPDTPPTYRETLKAYAEELNRLMKLLLQVMSMNLGLRATYLEEAFPNHTSLLRVNYYSPCPQPDLVLGVSPHSDGGIITLLLQDTAVEGLQVRKDGSWVSVQPIPNAVVVNLGDQMQIISNGKYTSMEHRAVTNSEKVRMSIVAFQLPDEETFVAPAAELIDDTNPAAYRGIKFGDYSRSFMSKELSGKSHIEALRLHKQNSV